MNPNAYQALREHAAWIDLSGRGKIRVTGDDRTRLLHAMCTNHVQQLAPGAGCYAFFLTAQGRIIADVNIYAMPDYLLLDTEPEVKQRVLEHLELYIIADDVSLRDFTSDTATISLEGPDAERCLNILGASPAHTPYSLVEWEHRQIVHWSYTGGPGYAIFVPSEQKAQLISDLQRAGAVHTDYATADVVRLENRHPRYGADFSESQIPHETLQMHAVHFSKGCYLGQEIVERVRSRGHVNRVLTSLEIDGSDVPGKGTSVQSDGNVAGEITSAAWSPARNRVVALGMLRTEALQSAAALTVNGVPAHAEKVS